MRLVKFVGHRGRYDFADQTDKQENFKNLLTRTKRIFRMDGAIDEFNGAISPQEVGDFAIMWWLFADGAGSIQHAKERAEAMAGWGAQWLFIQPEIEKAGRRWVTGRINSVRGNENVKNMPHDRQQMQANFQANYPAWRGTVSKAWHLDTNWYLDGGHHLDGAWYLDDGISMDGGWYLDDGSLLDSGLYLDGTGYRLNAVRGEAQIFGTGEMTVSNWGNHSTMPVFMFGGLSQGWSIGDGTIIGEDPPVYFGSEGGDVTDIQVEVWHDGRMTDMFQYAGRLAAAEYATVSSETRRVTKYAGAISNEWGNFQRLRGFGMPLFSPGETTLKIRANSLDAGCYFSVDFMDAWY